MKKPDIIRAREILIHHYGQDPAVTSEFQTATTLEDLQRLGMREHALTTAMLGKPVAPELISQARASLDEALDDIDSLHEPFAELAAARIARVGMMRAVLIMHGERVVNELFPPIL